MQRVCADGVMLASRELRRGDLEVEGRSAKSEGRGERRISPVMQQKYDERDLMRSPYRAPIKAGESAEVDLILSALEAAGVAEDNRRRHPRMSYRAIAQLRYGVVGIVTWAAIA